jgi:GNAT superfamily N-acetyltransferase
VRVQLYREHKYVSFLLSELERLVAKTDFTDSAAIAHVQSEWLRVKEMLEGHAYHEEHNFHALLEKKGSAIHREAHDDHEQQEETLKHLQLLLDAIKTSPDPVEAGYQFYLAYRKFVGDNLLHLHEEETKLLPELQRLCTDEELRAIEHPTYEVMTTDEMREMVQILFPHMNFSDKCAFLTDIKLAQPHKFLQLWERASSFLSAEEIARFENLQIIRVRSAERQEMEWVNDCYDQVEFVHSHFDQEIIAIAEFSGEKAGLGRLVKIDENNFELGGMYVFKPFRGKGIAREIVRFLLSHVKPSQTIYCIPFEHLLPFYKQCGFTACSDLGSTPSDILNKFRWCQEKYTQPTALLVLESSALPVNRCDK